MKIKKSEVVGLYNGINNVLSLSGVIFGYALNKNLSIIQSEIEALQKSIIPSKEFSEFETKRMDIIKKYAPKDEKGELIVKNKQYELGDKKEVIELEITPLREQYKEAIEVYEKQVEEYNKLIEQEINVELYKVKLENLPKDITAEQMKGIYLIIDGE